MDKNTKQFISTDTTDTTTTPSVVKVINLLQDDNNSIVPIYNTTASDESKNLPWYLILIIVFSVLILLLCIFLVCSDCGCENEVAPLNATGYANPCYETKVIDSVDTVVTNSSIQQGRHSIKRSQNPLYNSDSSIGSSQEDPKPHYDEVGRPSGRISLMVQWIPNQIELSQMKLMAFLPILLTKKLQTRAIVTLPMITV